MRAIYSEIVTLVIILLVIPAAKNIFSFAHSENLFKEYYDSFENEQSYYPTCTQRKSWKQSQTSSLREINDEGACLEGFHFSCVVSKLNVY